MDAVTKQRVRERAVHRCEYCRLREEFSGLRFHVEHIVARQHGGSDDLVNLALACPECNLRKGPNLAGIDPDTGQIANLFHPRHDRWEENFSVIESDIVGTTPVGRTTVTLLGFNTGDRLRLRRILLQLGQFR